MFSYYSVTAHDKTQEEIRITEMFVTQETKHLSAVRLCGSGGGAGRPVIRRMPVQFSASPSSSEISKWKITGSSNGRKVGNQNVAGLIPWVAGAVVVMSVDTVAKGRSRLRR